MSDDKATVWVAGSLASIAAGLICGLGVWTLLAEDLMPDLSETPLLVSHRQAMSPAKAAPHRTDPVGTASKAP